MKGLFPRPAPVENEKCYPKSLRGRKKLLSGLVVIGFFVFCTTECSYSAEPQSLRVERSTPLQSSGMRAASPQEVRSILKLYNAYFNGMKTLKAVFQEQNSKGGKASGVLYIKRPGHLRFTYHPKGRMELVTDGDHLIYYERQTGALNYSILKNTPLYFFLQDQVSLQEHFHFQTMRQTSNISFLTFVSKKDPHMGSVTLVFRNRPLELVQWILDDKKQGIVTTVTLSQLQTNIPLSDKQFHLKIGKGSY
jgi:outer membrane lipoprotein-sorting protein